MYVLNPMLSITLCDLFLPVDKSFFIFGMDAKKRPNYLIATIYLEIEKFNLSYDTSTNIVHVRHGAFGLKPTKKQRLKRNDLSVLRISRNQRLA